MHERAGELAGNVIAVVILLQVLARMSHGGNKLSNVRNFTICRSRDGYYPP